MRIRKKEPRLCHALPWYAERRRGRLKLCTYCKPPQWREISEFTTHPLTRDGLDNRCNFCRSAYRRRVKQQRKCREIARRTVIETRCPHGFLRSVVPCASCDGTEKANAPGKLPSGEQYNFVDLTGRTIAGASVLSRAPNVNGNARWRCHLPCGHVQVLEGIYLRAAEKNGINKLRCRECNPKGRIVSPPIKVKTAIDIPPTLVLQLDLLVTKWALKHKEEPEACRRAVEIAVLQLGIAELRKELAT